MSDDSRKNPANQRQAFACSRTQTSANDGREDEVRLFETPRLFFAPLVASLRLMLEHRAKGRGFKTSRRKAAPTFPIGQPPTGGTAYRFPRLTTTEEGLMIAALRADPKARLEQTHECFVTGRFERSADAK